MHCHGRDVPLEHFGVITAGRYAMSFVDTTMVQVPREWCLAWEHLVVLSSRRLDKKYNPNNSSILNEV
jgi:hypothetical protein